MKVQLLIGLICISSLVMAERSSAKKGARKHGATATLDLTVVDEKGAPVEDAQVEGWFWTYRKDNIDKEDTDDKGHAIVKGKSQINGGYTVTKERYYKTRADVRFSQPNDDCAKETFWGYEWVPPYKETVVLKTIHNPIPMYACRLSKSNFKLPNFNQAYPFDLQKMDWCSPHGKGIRDDVYIEMTEILNTQYGYMQPIKLTFTFKHPDEGMYITENDVSSDFKSAYHVNLNETYHSQIVQNAAKDNRSSFGEWNQHRIFRVRCKHDAEGKLISAHYGKIYGRWLIGYQKRFGNVLIYFNPTPNDTNLEYDMKRNLYKGDTYEEIQREDVLRP